MVVHCSHRSVAVRRVATTPQCAVLCGSAVPVGTRILQIANGARNVLRILYTQYIHNMHIPVCVYTIRVSYYIYKQIPNSVAVLKFLWFQCCSLFARMAWIGWLLRSQFFFIIYKICSPVARHYYCYYYWNWCILCLVDRWASVQLIARRNGCESLIDWI